MAEGKIAVERAHVMLWAKPSETRDVIDDDEQPERPPLAHKFAVDTAKDLHFRVRRKLDRDHAGVGRVAEQEAVRMELAENFLVGAHSGQSAIDCATERTQITNAAGFTLEEVEHYQRREE